MTGRSFVGITFKTATDEDLIPLSIESGRALAEELEALGLEAEAQAS